MTEKPEKTESLLLPMAPIVRLMKKNLDKEKLIKKTVKVEMNEWLAQMCEIVTKKMNQAPYASVDLHTFKDAIKIYNDVDHMEKDKQRIIISLEKIKQDCDALIRDLDRKLKI